MSTKQSGGKKQRGAGTPPVAGLSLVVDSDRLFSLLRCLELQARLLLVASVIEGFQLQKEDVRCLGAFLAEHLSKIKGLFQEV